MVVVLQLALTAGPPATRLSDVYGGAASVNNAATNIPYRQLIITTAGASAVIGSTPTVTVGTGMTLPLAAQLVLGPFNTGPVKLSDLYAVGTGATLTILGVPF